MVACPKCKTEVEKFLKKKHSRWVYCPSCQSPVPTTEMSNAPVEVVERYPWEKEEKPETVTEREPLFEVPKEPSQIVAEVLMEYGCAEEFVKSVTKYIERKGFLDPAWLFNMLMRARTGRRFTEAEAYMVIDEIVSAIEAERRKAEQLGKPFTFFVSGLYPIAPPPAPSFSFPVPLDYRATPTYRAPPTYPTAPQAPIQPTQQALQPTAPTTPSTTYYAPPPLPPPSQPQQRVPTLEEIQRIIAQAIEEKKKRDEIEAVREMVHSLERKVIEDKHALEKQLGSLKSEVTEVLAKLDEKWQERLSALLSKPSAPTAAEGEVITKKDLELFAEKQEKKFLEQQLKFLQEKLDALSRKVEEKAQPIIVGGEGWQKDETRLIATLGSQLLSIAKDRRPIEQLVRVVAPIAQQIPQRKQVGEAGTIYELIEQEGGVVE